MFNDSYPNKEIIIINDGSSNKDDSNITNWIEKHQDKIDIKYISRKNVGLTKTLNELISLANGKYIVLCASDDYLINDTVTKRVELLQQNPDKLMVLSDAIVVDNDDKKIMDSSMSELYTANKENYKTDDGLKYEIITNWSIAGATHLIDKRLYEEIGLYNENLIVEDWDFFLRAVAKDYILFYDEKVSAYRQHDTNLSSNPKKALRMHKDLYQSARKHLPLFDKKYKQLLKKKAKRYKHLIRNEERGESLISKIKRKTKPIRHQIKSLFMGVKEK
jgi:glycosyltransferase involved in cell wall biosynthesis